MIHLFSGLTLLFGLIFIAGFSWTLLKLGFAKPGSKPQIENQDLRQELLWQGFQQDGVSASDVAWVDETDELEDGVKVSITGAGAQLKARAYQQALPLFLIKIGLVGMLIFLALTLFNVQMLRILAGVILAAGIYIAFLIFANFYEGGYSTG